MTYRQHKLDVYQTQLFLARTPAEWRAMARRLDLPSEVPDSTGQTSFREHWFDEYGQDRHLIAFWLHPGKRHPAGRHVNTCAHEALHAAGFIFDWLGHDMADGDEPTAYLVGWLTQWLWEHTPSTT